MKFCNGGCLADVINSAKFYLNQIRGFDSVGSNFWLSHRNEMSPLTHGLNYRSACDSSILIVVCHGVTFWVLSSHALCVCYCTQIQTNVLWTRTTAANRPRVKTQSVASTAPATLVTMATASTVTVDFTRSFTSLKLSVRTMWWYQSTKTAKIFG